MKLRRTLSAFLALVMVLGSVYVGSVNTFAAPAAEEEEEKTIAYLSDAFKSESAKLATMKLVQMKGDYQLYYEEYTGEVAFVNSKTGNSIFSNPYDLADNGVNWASASTRRRLLSQLAVTYEENGKESTMYSYTDAAQREQILCKNIKNGIRVEYTIGEIATTRLVPRMISKTRFETMIKDKITDEAQLTRLMAFYRLYDTSDLSYTERQKKEIEASFPITKQFAVYVCTPDIETKELKTCESIIKAFCPAYTFEEMDQDHADCDYVLSDQAPPNFKMAIEYTIGDDGTLEARLPANGIRFDEENFSLKSVDILPYMGAGRTKNTGYTFIPDGSGTLIRFEDVAGKTYNVAGKMYGEDYAYHDISGQHSEVMRLPVFGVVENVKVMVQSEQDVGVMVDSGETDDRGYFAVITEGDSMATLRSEHGGNQHAYNNVYAKFEPRPSDRYMLNTTISVGTNNAVTKTTPRKYTGSYRINYTLLDDAKTVEANEGYEATYVGMAKAYRDYLEARGDIKKLENTGKDIPLYIETLGTDVMGDTFLSVPITVNTPLTTFEDVCTIYDELSENGVKNINFKLTGYYNGGLANEYPTKVKFEKAVGGSDGFEDLIKYSEEKDFGVYPEFDLTYAKYNTIFDGVSAKKDYIKSMDDRYMSRQEYDAATQEFTSAFELVISPSVYEKFIGKMQKSLSKYENLGGVSLSTFGKDLSSDFDEEDPYNREDSKGYTTEALGTLGESYDIMLEGGNAYTLPYADHIIALPTESSNLLNASESVPFEALVLHGYVNYTGSAVNMEGDVKNALLKSVENGAYLYFILCYQNTNILKNYFDTSKYYSVAYDIWQEDIVEYYNLLNEALGDLQESVIVDHEFMSDAFRTVTEEEKELTPEEQAEKEAAEKKSKEDKEREELRNALLASRGQEPEKQNSSARPNRGDAVTSSNSSKMAVELGTVVRVEYEGGVNFIINYNSHDIEVTYNGEKLQVPALDFVRVEKD